MLRKKSDAPKGILKKAMLANPANGGVGGETSKVQRVFILALRAWDDGRKTFTNERNPNGFDYGLADVRLTANGKQAQSGAADGAPDGSPVPIPPPLPGGDDGGTILNVSLLGSQAELIAAMRTAAAQTETGAVKIKGHGYNNSFETSVKAAAAEADELGCVILLLAEVSQGNLESYWKDETSFVWGFWQIYFSGIVQAVLAEFPVSILVHSLSGRLPGFLLPLLSLRFGCEGKIREPFLSSLSLCSPDEDRETAMTYLPMIAKCAQPGKTFIFVSDRDEALPKSEVDHGKPRLGQIKKGEMPPEISGVTWVNFSVRDKLPFGHILDTPTVKAFETGGDLPPGYCKKQLRDDYWIVSQDCGA